MKSIHIIGTQRSGSNLMRVMLNNHPKLSAHHPPHLMHTFKPLLPLYGSLKKEENIKQLIADLILFINRNPVPWDNFNPNVNDVFSKLENRTLYGVIRVLYEEYARLEKKQNWVCKSNLNVYYMKEILEEIPDTVFVHLVRDGRDVALSFQKAEVGHKHIYFLAKQWKEEQQKVADAKKLKAFKNKIIVIHYENFITNPKETITKILNSIGLKWHPDVLKYNESEESKKTSESGSMWKNVTKPVIKDNTKKYLKNLTANELIIFEKVAEKQLKNLGYPCYINSSLLKKTKLTSEQIENFSIENERLKSDVQKKHEKEMKLRDFQQQVIKEIKLRKK